MKQAIELSVKHTECKHMYFSICKVYSFTQLITILYYKKYQIVAYLECNLGENVD